METMKLHCCMEAMSCTSDLWVAWLTDGQEMVSAFGSLASDWEQGMCVLGISLESLKS